MGKEWYLAGRSSKRGVAKGVETTETQTPSGCMCAVFQFFDFHPFHFPTTINHQQHTPFKSTTCISEDHTTTIPKGAEAPRNSLESEDGTTTTTTTTTVSSFSKEDNFKIPKNIQIKTSGKSVGNLSDFSSEISSSPSTKTPTLVARLMGLDLLPGADSPSFSSSLSTPNLQNNTIPHLHHLRTRQQHIQTKHRNSIDSSDIAASTCSLPETPRISSARRSDVDHHHRLSLQIHKENLGEELELPRFSFSKRKCDENNSRSSSPSHYARQIVKQVKESVSRKVGQDITNTLKIKDQAREESLGQCRVKKFSKTSLKTLDESSPGKHSNTSSSSCSPRLRFMDTKNKPSTTTTSPITSKEQNTHPNVVKVKLPQPSASVVNTQPQVPRVLTKPKVYALPEQQKLVPKCKKVTNEKFSCSRFKRPPQTSDIIRNKQEETFTRANNDIKITKGKKAQPLSSNLLNNNNINNVPNLLPVKIDPSPPATKISQKQSQVSDTQESKHCSQLSSCSRQRYKQEGTTTLATQETSTNTQDKLNGPSTTTTTTTGAAEHHSPEFQYITQILNRTNALNTTTTVFFNQWFSPTHPLDPSIFHHLEHHPNDKDRNFTTKNQLGHRWNRRLMFDLVDEVLKEILRPKSSEKSLCFLNGFCYNWSIGELTERVWKRVGDFPCAKCEVLEDIDNLIEAEDMEKMKVVEGEEEKEEGERLVAEIEGKILDTLVHETVVEVEKVGSMLF